MSDRSLAQRVLLGLGALLVVLVSALVVYIAYPTAARWTEVRALASGERVSATVLALEDNPLVPCRSFLLLGGWRRCGGEYAYTALTLERAGERSMQRFFPARLLRPLELAAGSEVRAVLANGRLLVDERAYGFVPLASEPLQTDLWIVLTFILPLALFWWVALNLERWLFGEG